MSLLRPEALLLLALVPLLWFVPRRVRNGWHGVLRSLVVALLVVAIAGPVRRSDAPSEHHVVVLDASASVDDETWARLESTAVGLIERIERDGPRGLVLFGDASRSVRADSAARFDRILRVGARAGTSPIGAALAAARGLIPVGSSGGVTLLSDGRATSRNWGALVSAFTVQGVPVHTVELDAPTDDTFPVRLQVQEPIRAGRTARAFIDVAGHATRFSLELVGPEGVLARRDGLSCDGRRQCALEFDPPDVPFLAIEARVVVEEGANRRTDNDTLRDVVPVQLPLRILYLGHRMREGAPRLGDLLGPGFAVDAPELDAVPADTVSDYDLVMLDDRPASLLPRAFQDRLVAAVRDEGCGLLASGGGASFGAGGYHDTPVAKALPVEFVHKEEKKDPSTSLAIIIDTSGSMSGNRIRLAKEVTRLAIRRLLPHDKVGIVEFYGNKRWAAPLQSAAHAIDIQRALNRLDAGGGTILYPAIEEAYYGLRNAQTRYKHVLVLTDAGVETGPYESLLRRMARDGICVSTVLVGPGRHAEFLVQLADWGNGRYYNAANRFNLPEVMLKQPSTARLPSYRPGVHRLRARGGLGWWGETDPTSVPPLAGYVESRSRIGAEVVLQTAADEHPVLASWRYGLGRVSAFMTEPTGPGTGPWSEWKDYGSFLGRVLTRTASDVREPHRYTLTRHGARLTLRAEARVPNAPAPRAAWSFLDGTETAPRGARNPLELRERAPGVHTSTFVADPSRAIAVHCGDPKRPYRLASRAFADRAPEHQVDPRRALDLQLLAEATGGTHARLADAATLRPTAGRGPRPLAIVDLAPWCLLLALFTYLADIVHRRWPRRRRPA